MLAGRIEFGQALLHVVGEELQQPPRHRGHGSLDGALHPRHVLGAQRLVAPVGADVLALQIDQLVEVGGLRLDARLSSDHEYCTQCDARGAGHTCAEAGEGDETTEKCCEMAAEE